MRKILLGILIAVSIVVGGVGASKASACGFFVPCDSPTSEQDTIKQNQAHLIQAVPAPKLDTSLERINISKRLQLFSDKNKISYIYLVSYGRVMAFYTVKGKVSSGNKRLTNPQQIVDDCGQVIDIGGYDQSKCSGGSVVNSPELDGTYGNSSDYIFFWTTDGTYVQWNGEYMLADQPLQLTTQPELVRSIK